MRVLIADDDPATTATLAILAKSWGYKPITVHDGPAALTVLHGTDAPTLAVLDWFMPGMKGPDICREIRQEQGRPYTYVILVTGHGAKEDMLDGLEAGADDYLMKPVAPDELRARLTTAKRILDLQEQLLASQRLLKEQATRDALTGLWNRAMILDILDRELARSRRGNHAVSVVMTDIDYFKQVNDTLGHLTGDEVLRQLAQRLMNALRPYDMVGRYGGEEFLIVLPGCNAEVALNLAERLRTTVAAERVQDGDQRIAVTLSLGVADWDGAATAADLLRAADQALYAAKAAGRNRSVRGQCSGT
jgi:diguanylate cyclase (GGDEF)-like protein